MQDTIAEDRSAETMDWLVNYMESAWKILKEPHATSGKGDREPQAEETVRCFLCRDKPTLNEADIYYELQDQARTDGKTGRARLLSGAALLHFGRRVPNGPLVSGLAVHGTPGEHFDGKPVERPVKRRCKCFIESLLENGRVRAREELYTLRGHDGARKSWTYDF
jgi:hypothetical protein